MNRDKASGVVIMALFLAAAISVSIVGFADTGSGSSIDAELIPEDDLKNGEPIRIRVTGSA
jgi:hypothetical protein